MINNNYNNYKIYCWECSYESVMSLCLSWTNISLIFTYRNNEKWSD